MRAETPNLPSAECADYGGDPGADWGRRGRFPELIGVALGDSLALVNRTTDGSVCVNESSERKLRPPSGSAEEIKRKFGFGVCASQV